MLDVEKLLRYIVPYLIPAFAPKCCFTLIFSNMPNLYKTSLQTIPTFFQGKFSLYLFYIVQYMFILDTKQEKFHVFATDVILMCGNPKYFIWLRQFVKDFRYTTLQQSIYL